jgi:acetyltransferase
VVEQRAIREIEINPLSASSSGLVALDARVVLQPAGLGEKDLPKLAIRPYPSQYARSWTMKNGVSVIIRPIRPEDESLMVQFHRTLSDESVHSRYFHMVGLSQRIQHDRLARVCFIDYDREMALVVECNSEGLREIIAVGRLSRIRESAAAEFAIIVSDRWQRHGLGVELLRRLVEIAGDEGIGRVVGAILPENHSMEALSRRLGFVVSYDPQDGVLKATLDVPTRHPVEKACRA